MAFNYKPINDNDVFPIAKDRINEIGHELARLSDLEFLGEVTGVDFNTIGSQIQNSGVYYLTSTKNYPNNANWNGFVRLDKRNNNYMKVFFTPFNSEKTYVRTMINNQWGEWDSYFLDSEKESIQTYKLTDSNGQVEYNKNVNSTNIQGTKSLYGTLQDPPIGENPEGWINYIQAQGDKSSIIEFTPVNSTKLYRKVRKLPEQTQNPNLLEDALFKKYYAYPRFSTYDIIENYTWETNANDSEIRVNYDITYNGAPTFMIVDTYTGDYPMVRSRPLKIGEDIQEGDTLTFSAYFMTPDVSKLKDNNVYLDVASYKGYPGSSNPSIKQKHYYIDDLADGEWKLFTITVTVPSGEDYVCAMMRLSLNESGNKNGFVGYYALPKLEHGNERTPFITHENDSVYNQYDEIWSQWNEYLDKIEMNKYVPDNMENGYLDYVWTKGSTGGRSFYDLLDQIPRGTHTFYCSYNVIDNPSDKPVRGTIIVNYGSNDIHGDHKVTMYCVDDIGRMFTYHKEGDERTNIRQSDVKTTLWEGKLDFGESKEIELIEDYTNFDYLEVTYHTSSAGHRAVRKINVDSGDSNFNFYIRDFNLANSSTNTNVDFSEGYMTNVGNKKFKTGMSKRLKHSGTGNATIESWNTMGEITIYNVVGVLGE